MDTIWVLIGLICGPCGHTVITILVPNSEERKTFIRHSIWFCHYETHCIGSHCPGNAHKSLWGPHTYDDWYIVGATSANARNNSVFYNIKVYSTKMAAV